ncbi:helix-turn-helix transcriptional regulator [Nocardia ninae]|uniref:Uncharacterized protein n=1 Tax=Nocardia ninae NBRC 108245 TaxID=1210091 RepID=A0A511MIM5_9NOCA|nr:helix-turn-helix transcriptional regulator [Nocardia ninae]GEM39937.1 hypothetical protein NN4_44560 [Nocardia ninae NBRC 108245]
MVSSGHPEFFATVIKARRNQLGMTIQAVSAADGPAVPTIVKAEARGLRSPQPKTFAKFDTALRWEPGSAARAYWSAEQPASTDTPRLAPAPLRAGHEVVGVPLDRVLALTGLQRELNAAADSGESLSAADIQQFARRLDREISSIIGAWATDMLEINRSRGTTHAGLEIALAEALAAPVDRDDPDAEERWYRRWLLGGREAAGVGKELREKFELRYQQSRQRGGEND